MLKSLKFGPLKTDNYHKNTLRINLEAILQYKLHDKCGGELYEWAPGGSNCNNWGNFWSKFEYLTPRGAHL